jgi:hypothetical protein
MTVLGFTPGLEEEGAEERHKEPQEGSKAYLWQFWQKILALALVSLGS